MRTSPPTTRALPARALLVAAVSVSLAAAVLRPAESVMVLLVVPFAVVGAVLATKRPAHPVGWLFGTFAAAFAVSVLAAAYATVGLAAIPEWPGARLAAWAFTWLWLAYVSLLELAFLLFPDGHVAGRRWRWAGVAIVGLNVLHALARAFRPGPLEDRAIDNPVGLPALAGLPDPATLLGPLFFVGLLVALASPLARLRRASGVEREQIKWVASAGVLLALGVVLSGGLQQLGVDAVLSDLCYVVGVVAVPIAMGIAILRYRLYDIDVIIRRTLVYAAVSGVLLAAYAVTIGLAQLVLAPLTGGSGIAVAVSTLAVVALFQPVRRRIGHAVDRRFYRARYDAERTLDRFAARLREQVDLTMLERELLAVIGATLQPARASVWLRRR
jgi:hypothetical protein